MPKKPKPPLTARIADPQRLYELAVQAPDAEVEFVTRTFHRLTGRPARRLREDFCGSAACACEWVKAHKSNTAIGLDLHQPTLAWGMRHNVAKLSEEAQERVRLLARNVLHPGAGTGGVDTVLAMNFSYWVFKTRPLLRRYFEAVRRSLVRDGVFFLDIYGGYEAQKIQTERRRCAGFTYVWDQASFDPITYAITCHIHFDFKRGPMLRRAFTYDWRLWTIPEVRELLAEAGFRRSTVYWEGDDHKGGGNGVFRQRKVGEACAAFIAYIVAEK
jgi:hypothetical protein